MHIDSQNEQRYDSSKLMMHTEREKVARNRTFNGRIIHSRRYPMNIFTPTSQNQENLDSKTPAVRRGKKLAVSVGLIMALSFIGFSAAWAGDYSHAKAPAAPIHLTSLSIQIGPGGFHFGIGSPFYGPAYVRPHVYVQPAPHRHWKHSRHQGNRQHYASPQRHNRGHGWKNHNPRGNSRGNGGGGNRGHRGGHR